VCCGPKFPLSSFKWPKTPAECGKARMVENERGYCGGRGDIVIEQQRGIRLIQNRLIPLTIYIALFGHKIWHYIPTFYGLNKNKKWNIFWNLML